MEFMLLTVLGEAILQCSFSINVSILKPIVSIFNSILFYSLKISNIDFKSVLMMVKVILRFQQCVGLSVSVTIRRGKKLKVITK